MTTSNITKFRLRFQDRPSDWKPCSQTQGADDYELIFEDNDTRVYRKRVRQTTVDDRISGGKDDGTEIRLREKQPERIKKLLTQADINRANAEFWKRK
jgi:hypothetical protein